MVKRRRNASAPRAFKRRRGPVRRRRRALRRRRMSRKVRTRKRPIRGIRIFNIRTTRVLPLVNIYELDTNALSHSTWIRMLAGPLAGLVSYGHTASTTITTRETSVTEPFGLNVFQALYKSYRVTKVTYRVQLINQTRYPMHAIKESWTEGNAVPPNVLAPPTTDLLLSEYMEKPGHVTQYVRPGENDTAATDDFVDEKITILTGTILPWTNSGLTKAQWMNDPDTAGLLNDGQGKAVNPVKWTNHIIQMVAKFALTTGDCRWRAVTRMSYTIDFFNPIEPCRSLETTEMKLDYNPPAE